MKNLLLVLLLSVLLFSCSDENKSIAEKVDLDLQMRANPNPEVGIVPTDHPILQRIVENPNDFASVWYMYIEKIEQDNDKAYFLNLKKIALSTMMSLESFQSASIEIKKAFLNELQELDFIPNLDKVVEFLGQPNNLLESKEKFEYAKAFKKINEDYLERASPEFVESIKQAETYQKTQSNLNSLIYNRWGQPLF